MAAVALFLLAVAGYALLVHASPQYYWTQIDTAVYRDGGIAVRNQPAMLYALELGPAKLPFIYTPFAALLFAGGSGASFATWQVGLAAGIKLTPLIFIPYLLFTRRVRAAAVSALTFAVTVGLGFALLPHASAVYWGGQFFRPSKHPFHLDDQSLSGVILRLTHAGPDAHVYWLVAAV